MTVKELIKYLKDYDKNAIVVLPNYATDETFGVLYDIEESVYNKFSQKIDVDKGIKVVVLSP